MEFRIVADTEDNLLAALGYGGVLLGTVINKLVDLYKKEQQEATTKDLAAVLAELKPRKSRAKASHGILVKGEEGIMVKLARCCNPIPGDPVVGYITRGTGVSVHRADCINVLHASKDERSRMIEVTWDIGIDDVYKVNLAIVTADRPGLISDILSITTDYKMNIFDLKCRLDKSKNATINMGLDVASLEQLENVMNRIRRMKDVYTVERVVSNGSMRKN